MGIWYRVFGTNEAQPDPALLVEQAQRLGYEVEVRLKGDDQGWFQAELWHPSDGRLVLIERFLAQEEGIRPEMNTWAAWLETIEHNSHQGRLMQQIISTRQLFTLQALLAENAAGQALCPALCRTLAQATAGVYQVDNLGFFEADGTLLVEEAA